MFFFISFLFSVKSKDRRVEQVLPMGEGWQQWEVGGDGKGGRR
jgi:hypothetical protein